MVTGKPGLKKLVYAFSEGDASLTDLLGGKGSNLCEMFRLGLPVPPGFVISTETCLEYFNLGNRLPDGLTDSIRGSVGQIEEAMGRKFGSLERPLLVSVRSGARVSMPGMMETVLNLGLNDEIVAGLIKKSGDERFCYDVYRRFVQMYGDVVMGLRPKDKEIDPFEHLLETKKEKHGVEIDSDLPATALKELVAEFKAVIKKRLKRSFPENPKEQLYGSIGAVFSSWQGDRAIRYREIESIPHNWGTAVNVQSMVYGNMGEESGTGVAFTRNPSTGENTFYGEFLVNAQGEDVVAGIRTPQPVAEMPDWKTDSMRDLGEQVYQQLLEIKGILEDHYRDMQDIEFTV
ncbi:MAG TPA: pyruvate, phosphate dikinase, partial [Dehalococcoidia bacterium]|nr:pyruvate, phosphate dikinase [Dehalococcoidia bacterium]